MVVRTYNAYDPPKAAFVHAAEAGAVQGILATVETWHPATRRHMENVNVYARLIGRELSLSPQERYWLQIASLLHDAGKVSIPVAVLDKTAPLDVREARLLLQHPDMGAAIVRECRPLEPVVAAVRHHHEWWDGRGYPSALSGPAIPPAARIIAVADAFESMTASRPYRQPRAPVEAVAEIQRGAGTQFDPEVVAAFLSLWRGALQTGVTWALASRRRRRAGHGLRSFRPLAEQRRQTPTHWPLYSL